MKIFCKITLLFLICSKANSAPLFEVKNDTGKIIMEVSDDGVRFFNPQYSPVGTEKDTLMIISATNIKALVRKASGSSSSRDFDIADIGSIRKGTGKSVMKMSVNEGYGVGGDSAVVFYKPKNAFRTNSILQDVDLVGDGSFAAGYLNQASGGHSTAFGANSVASGGKSTAFGNQTVASGYASFTSGQNSKAQGMFSTAFGDQNTAAGASSFAGVSGSSATGNYSLALGNSVSATGYASTAFGSSTMASGQASIAMGGSTVASGYFSTATGQYTNAQSKAVFVAGAFNKIEGNPNEWVYSDPLFVVGNGLDNEFRSNAFEVKKSGEIFIPKLWDTNSANAKKTVMVDNQGKLCVVQVKDDGSNNSETEQMQNENNDLKTKILALDKTTSEQEERIVKLEAMLNLLLKNNK